jgi:iron-sulfur cluster repair protein YtfE (RIC family)
MLRDKSLIPLSHQHQHALGLCVRIDRAQPIPVRNLPQWLEEIERDFAEEFENHFSAEESVLFPAACQISELVPLVDELTAEHAGLRQSLSQAVAGTMSLENLVDFATRLSEHIRKEERKLFQLLQEFMNPAQLADLGTRLESVLAVAERTCTVPNEATRLRRKS